MTTTQYHIQVNAKKLINNLSVAATVLLCEHGVLFTYHYLVTRVPWLIRDFFDVDKEENLPTWFSEFNLLVATTILWIVLREKRASGDPMSGRWMLLFLGFCFLSIDEIAGIHEMINTATSTNWAYGGAVISFVLLVYFISFLQSLPRETIVGFLLAGAIFVGGSVGMELVGAPMKDNSLVYKLTTMIEEGMEMFGIILFTRTLLVYMANPSLMVSIGRNEPPTIHHN